MTRRILILATYLSVALASAVAFGQTPDKRGEVALSVPRYHGVTASAPIPPSMHTRNEGGSDGAGLCVISSILTNGRYQRVPGLENGKASRLWQVAKSRPGGYGPDKLAGLLRETNPDERYTSYTGTDTNVLDRWSREGYPIGATMRYGQGYSGTIHHMISLIHYRLNQWACVVDNNFPGEFHWMPAKEYDNRWPDGGIGWAFRWDRAARVGGSGLALLILAVAALIYFHQKQDEVPANA